MNKQHNKFAILSLVIVSGLFIGSLVPWLYIVSIFLAIIENFIIVNLLRSGSENVFSRIVSLCFLIGALSVILFFYWAKVDKHKNNTVFRLCVGLLLFSLIGFLEVSNYM